MDRGTMNWDQLVADSGPVVWKTLWRLLGERADVEDCFQETFVAALKLAKKELVTCWPAMLCRLATARGLDRLRKRYRRDGKRLNSESPHSETPSHEAGPVDRAIAAELSERLRKALVQLPPNQAEAFSLHAMLGWSHREIGERLNLTENAVSVTVHRARQRLQELLRSNL